MAADRWQGHRSRGGLATPGGGCAAGRGGRGGRGVLIELSARIDSVKGGIRSTFAQIPDVPVSRFILNMQGGRKSLIVNSRHPCHKPGRNRAKANLTAQNIEGRGRGRAALGRAPLLVADRRRG